MRERRADRWAVRALVLTLISVGGSVVAMGGQSDSLGAVNLIEDPGFESGVSGFSAQDPSSSVTQSAEAPLEGAHSLRVSIAGYGNNIWWVHSFSGGLASRFVVTCTAALGHTEQFDAALLRDGVLRRPVDRPPVYAGLR